MAEGRSDSHPHGRRGHAAALAPRSPRDWPASATVSTPAWKRRSRRTTSSLASRPSSRPSAPARSPAASTARRSSTPRRTSPTPASKSSAPPAWSARPTSPCPGLTENIELNVQITGRPVTVLQEWYEEHWNAAEDVTPEILRVIERHTRDYSPFEVYAKSLYELHRRLEPTDERWLAEQSRVYPILDQYQKRRLPQTAGDRRAARRRLPVRRRRSGQNLRRPDAAGIPDREEAQARRPVRAQGGTKASLGKGAQGPRSPSARAPSAV